MEVDAVLEEVQSILQDDAYSESWIIGRFNEALLLVATMCRIPSLQMTVPLTAAIGTTSMIMPKTYLHDLFLVTTSTYPTGVTIYPNIKDYTLIMGDGADDTGPVKMVSLDALVLSYWPTPDVAEVLTCSYYAKPVTLDSGDDFPAYIPEVLQRTIFQYYALKEAYIQIEDGTDGKPFNTERYTALAMSGIQSLTNFYPSTPKLKPIIRRCSSHY